MTINTPKYLFTAGNLGSAPDRPGVYGLYQDGVTTYYGRALVSIRTRLISHYNGTEGRCTQQASHFNWELCADPPRREEGLLREHRQRYGRLPRCNERVG